MDERLRFVARLLEGEKMAVLCREFDISRKKRYAPRMKTMMDSLFAMLAAGEIKPERSAMYPMDRVVDALNSVTARESTRARFATDPAPGVKKGEVRLAPPLG